MSSSNIQFKGDGAPGTQPKQGWGFSNNAAVKLDISQKAEKKTNIWDLQNEIVIPDLEEDPSEISLKQVSQPPQAIGKGPNLTEINQMERQYTLPQTEEGIDLGILLSNLRPMEDILEKDEGWEFQKLKSEIYEIVSGLYGVNEFYDEDK